MDAATQLAPISETPRLDAELLMAHALEVSREELLLQYLDVSAPRAFAPLLQRRLAHEPVAYITGTRAFWKIELHVGPGVLIPRPDSETLLEAAVEYFGDRDPTRILDLGTGPGTLLLAALAQWPEAHGLGIDASQPALDYASGNAEALGLADRATFKSGNWAKDLDGQFDLILANPPYIGRDEPLPRDVGDYEPGIALFAGADGLDAYRAIIPDLPRLLAPGGAACIEVGATQGAAVAAMLRLAGLAAEAREDLAGIMRCLIARRE